MPWGKNIRTMSKWTEYQDFSVKKTTFNGIQFVRIMDTNQPKSARAVLSIPISIVGEVCNYIEDIRDPVDTWRRGLATNGAMSTKDWSNDLTNYCLDNKFLINQMEDTKVDDIVCKQREFSKEGSSAIHVILSFIRYVKTHFINAPNI